MITLTDPQVNVLLEGLTRQELTEFREAFADMLYQFSKDQSDESAGNDALFQIPHRSATYSTATGATTLYMPSKGPNSMGIKVVTLSAPRANAPEFSSPLPPICPTGALTIFNLIGEPLGFLHCGTLTGFRTALASNILINRRQRVKIIVVFGAGIQAYWHVRIALMQRGQDIHKVYFISRSVSMSALAMIEKFYAMDPRVKEREGWADTKFEMVGESYFEYPRLVREYLRHSDVIICCTPSTKPLFDHEILTSHAGRKKGRLIIAVGSYQPHMRELPEELLHQATKTNQKKCRVHFHKHADEGGYILVDTASGVLKEAGEVISAGITGPQMVELGELRLVREMDEAERAAAAAVDVESDNDHDDCDTLCEDTTAASSPAQGYPGKPENESFPSRWLFSGNVIYKSVGMGAMDLAAGTHVINLARKKNIGVDIPGF